MLKVEPTSQRTPPPKSVQNRGDKLNGVIPTKPPKAAW